MAHFYTYIDPAEIEAQFNKEEGDDDEDDKSRPQRMELEMSKKTKIWTVFGEFHDNFISDG